MATVVRCGTLFDGTGSEPLRGGVVVIDGDRIQVAGAAETIGTSEGAAVIDLSRNFVMPGLVDAHSHASINPGAGDQTGQMRRPAVKQALQATANLRRDLLAGTTSMRIMAEEHFLDMDLRESIERGVIAGHQRRPDHPCSRSGRCTSCQCWGNSSTLRSGRRWSSKTILITTA
jgi:imidazolonepropionase-like amidohydrolase